MVDSCTHPVLSNTFKFSDVEHVIVCLVVQRRGEEGKGMGVRGGLVNQFETTRVFVGGGPYSPPHVFMELVR